VKDWFHGLGERSGGADGYIAAPESLRLGVDVGAGREFVDLGFGTIEREAREQR
jgi:hypothetical protein